MSFLGEEELAVGQVIELGKRDIKMDEPHNKKTPLRLKLRI